ncbi:(d)CMP kinase [Desulfobacterium sp. N47]|uniref:Cytidylate kinase n=1 Tax=uncultured Desulfobacterium sp. TaxID=201089 RepID=E1Y8T9_9BACT|nr:Cytidylate kinase [uncultured Desulfobacterium sp.]
MNKNTKLLLITIDGPAGAGKTTVSKILAERLGYKYIDTGALYRGVAYEAKKSNISSDDDAGLEKLCATLCLEFIRNENGLRLFSNQIDISDEIRTPEMSMLASAVSARKAVREYLLSRQKELGKGKGAVFEGRDMGTVVFPLADVKFYLDASVKTRAKRRYKELIGKKDSPTLEEIEDDIKHRDENDKNRKLAPLKAAEDAIIIDSTELGIDAVVNHMLSHIINCSS